MTKTKSWLAALLLAAGALRAADAPLPTDTFHPYPGSTTTVQVLDNGLTVILTEDAAQTMGHVLVWVKAGSTDEALGKTGIAHLFEHMMFQPLSPGAKTFFDQAADWQANASAYTAMLATVFYADLPPTSLQDYLLADARRFAGLRVDDALLEVEKGAVRSELRGDTGSSSSWMAREALLKHAFAGRSWSWSPLGHLADMAAIKAQDCQAFFDAHYRPENSALILDGPWDRAQVLALAQQAYGPWQGRGPAAKAPKAPRFGPGTAATLKVGGQPWMLAGIRLPEPGLRPGGTEDLLVHILFYSRAALATRDLVASRQLVHSISPWGMAEDCSLLKIFLYPKDPGSVPAILDQIEALPEDIARLLPAQFEDYRHEWQAGYREDLLTPGTMDQRLGQAWSRQGLDLFKALLQGQDKPSQAEVVALGRSLLAKGNLTAVSNEVEP